MNVPDNPSADPSFEEALLQLDRIVEGLERGEPELTTALSKYEKGIALLNRCYRLLDQAEHSVALVTGVDSQGNPVTAPFDASATLTREPASESAAPLASAEPPPVAASPTSYRKVRKPPIEHPDPESDPPF